MSFNLSRRARREDPIGHMVVQTLLEEFATDYNRSLGKFKGGTATINNPATAVNVSHGLTSANFKVSVTPTADLGAGVRMWVSGKTSTQFTINVSAAPAVAFTFDWLAREDTF